MQRNMNQKQEDKERRFWSGYALGAFSAGVVAFALGTKIGRSKVRKMMDVIEDSSNLTEMARLMTDMFPELVNNFTETEKTDVNQVMNKMKTISTDDTKTKKFKSR